MQYVSHLLAVKTELATSTKRKKSIQRAPADVNHGEYMGGHYRNDQGYKGLI